MEGSKITHTLGSFSTLGTLKVAMFAFFTLEILGMKLIARRSIDKKDLWGADLSSLEGKTLVSISTSSQMAGQAVLIYRWELLRLGTRKTTPMHNVRRTENTNLRLCIVGFAGSS